MARNTSTTTKTASTTATATPTNEGTRSIRIDGNVAHVQLTVRKSKDSAPIDLEAAIDFTGCSTAQILTWATRTKIIDLQRALRLCDEAFLRDLAKRGPIRRLATEAGTGFVDPAKAMTQMANRISQMSAEDKAALLELLKANA